MFGVVGNFEKKRIAYLDGLRGVAITMVVLFHAYAAWPDRVPFHDEFLSFPLFANGWLGVELFFMISGFVIFMTLESCRGFGEFIWRRWLRLFPAMLVCSLFIYATAPLFWERPLGMPALRNLLPGLTFIQNTWWSWLLGSSPGILEVTFWSLYVEVKFYVISGVIYFLFGEAWALDAIAFLFVGALIGKELGIDWLNAITVQLDTSYFGWFTTGALFYRWHKSGSVLSFALALVFGTLSIFILDKHRLDAEIVAGVLIALFAAANTSALVQRILSFWPLLMMGFVSYPLYLLHEQMMIAMIEKLGRRAPWIPDILYPAVPVGIIFCLAWIVAAFAEPWLRSGLRRSGLVAARGLSADH